MLRWEAGPQGSPQPHTILLLTALLSLYTCVYSLCLHSTSPPPTTHSRQALNVSVIDTLAMET